MNSPKQSPMICKRHHQPITFYSPQDKAPFCQLCIQEKAGLIPFEDLNSELNDLIRNGNKEFDGLKQQLQQLLDLLLTHKQNIILGIDKILQLIMSSIKLIQPQKEQFQSDVETNIKQGQQILDGVLQDIGQLLLGLQSKFNIINDLQGVLKLPQQVNENQEIQREEKEFSEKFEYELIKKYAEKDSCIAFDFNRDNSNDNSIIIWSTNNNKKWIVQQTLKDHSEQVSCLSINHKDNLLISGSLDKTIKFWRKSNDNWSCSQTIGLENQIIALSLNDEGNKLITCAYYLINIYMLELQKNVQLWTMKQSIHPNQRGFRLCFTVGNQFIYQPYQLSYLEVYDYYTIDNNYYLVAKVEIQYSFDCSKFFPCQFIKQLNILAVKHGNHLNIFKVNQQRNYHLIQTLEFQHNNELYGRMTNDGQYLVTWDRDSKEVQVRKLKLKND